METKINAFSRAVIRRANARLVEHGDLSNYEFDKRFVPKTRDELRAAFIKASRAVNTDDIL